jgi:hypothetical protein
MVMILADAALELPDTSKRCLDIFCFIATSLVRVGGQGHTAADSKSVAGALAGGYQHGLS